MEKAILLIIISSATLFLGIDAIKSIKNKNFSSLLPFGKTFRVYNKKAVLLGYSQLIISIITGCAIVIYIINEEMLKQIIPVAITLLVINAIFYFYILSTVKKKSK